MIVLPGDTVGQPTKEVWMRFTFTRSHAFPRGRVTVIGEWRPDGDDILLDVPRYRTSKGTTVDARGWRLARNEKGDWRSHRVA